MTAEANLSRSDLGVRQAVWVDVLEDLRDDLKDSMHSILLPDNQSLNISNEKLPAAARQIAFSDECTRRLAEWPVVLQHLLMETFFSHLNFLREFVVDPEGSQFHDLATAGSEARQAIHDMAAERLKDRRQFYTLEHSDMR